MAGGLGLSLFIILPRLLFAPRCSFALMQFDSVCTVFAVIETMIPPPFVVESCRGQTLLTIADGRRGDGF